MRVLRAEIDRNLSCPRPPGEISAHSHKPPTEMSLAASAIRRAHANAWGSVLRVHARLVAPLQVFFAYHVKVAERQGLLREFGEADGEF